MCQDTESLTIYMNYMYNYMKYMYNYMKIYINVMFTRPCWAGQTQWEGSKVGRSNCRWMR